jgi:hypothetical protein
VLHTCSHSQIRQIHYFVQRSLLQRFVLASLALHAKEELLCCCRGGAPIQHLLPFHYCQGGAPMLLPRRGSSQPLLHGFEDIVVAPPFPRTLSPRHPSQTHDNIASCNCTTTALGWAATSFFLRPPPPMPLPSSPMSPPP